MYCAKPDMLLSILIPTLETRQQVFSTLFTAINRQIAESNLSGEVEVLYECDKGEQSIGGKRNLLLNRARGQFVSFVDDDDALNPEYVWRICEAIRDHPSADCIGMNGTITFRGSRSYSVTYSLRYNDFFSRNHNYFRLPIHFNPVRREIALRYRFAEISY